ncbi:type II secretion system protein [Candidatus Uhrbacteria bacterium]|nr:type II secretion system protein [Candidatus Uhrbacteria bacterium]
MKKISHFPALPKTNARGFTLLELMVVIAVSGILASIGVVIFTSVKQSTAVRLAAENFAGFLRTTESMTRSGTPFDGSGTQHACNNDPAHQTKTPCGGYGVVVRSDGAGYDRYADLTPNCVTPVLLGGSVQSPCTTSTPLKDSTDLASVEAVVFTDSILMTTGRGVQVEFVPPKDGICVYDPAEGSDKTNCGPWQAKTITWTFGYGPTGSSYQRTVTLNTVSGAVVVK